MSTSSERAEQLHLVSRLRSAFPELPDAPTADMLDHPRIKAYLKPVHDVVGEPDAPLKYENKQYEQWEELTYIMCEVLGARGIWMSEERRRIGNVDVGRAQYLGLPYYARWLIAVARVLVEKHLVTLGEVSERMAEVQARYAGGLDGKKLEAQPKSVGDGSGVARNSHHTRAQGIGDPQIYAGKAGEPAFAVGDSVVVRDIPVIFYTRTPEYVRGATGRIATVAYESPAAEDETWGLTDAPAEWFYIVEFDMPTLWYGYTGAPEDKLRTEIPQRWLAPA
ncbi:nitrile hydratase subunit beta [Mycolicibacterium parafortuitum]|uniref:nitrile hydratase n=1 Tax=Mycolicibacterium parafortuitum TaxID=39692 RepID=A0A7I7TVP2_MYCPF|nr:SH3-like domain-containing protein [Mycolicibacterium parafortuitum]PQE00357.1 nitrile hydratase subunit beta [Mycobacterium sp. EPG1]BBY73228.1 nitrile hydratase subunit beta [Mycolicibacterium parafortuitum]